MSQIPLFIPFLFICVTVLALAIYYQAFQRSTKILVLITSWFLIQAVLVLLGFYHADKGTLPRFLLLILPPILFILLVLLKGGGKRNYRPSLKWLTLFHILRIPVELVLFCLFVYHKLPREMTFEGKNFDILAGLTAPFVFYYGFVKERLSLKVIIAWNIVGLILLINIVLIAFLSMPTVFQKFGAGQPNIAFFYFPFIWLPCGLVPMVIYAHLVTIRNLIFTGRPGINGAKSYSEIKG